MANQISLPVIGNSGNGAASPQPVKNPVARGNPPEGPQSALIFLVIPVGSTSGSITVDVSQFGMSMVQSLLVDNEANGVGISVNAGTIGVTYGIQPAGTQIIPVFQTGTSLNIVVNVNGPFTIPVSLAFQIFNFEVAPASWVANLSVNGNVNIANVGGSVNVQVANSNLIGVGLAAEITGGAKSMLLTTISARLSIILKNISLGIHSSYSVSYTTPKRGRTSARCLTITH